MIKKKTRKMENIPLTPIQYWGYSMLYSIPILGIIMRNIHRRTSKNINLVNYATSYSLTFWIKFFIVVAIIAFLIAVDFVDWLYAFLNSF